METTPKILNVKPLPNRHLEVTFNNGIIKDYDCNAVMERPEFFLLRDELFFRSVKVDSGGYGISWNDKVDLSNMNFGPMEKIVMQQMALHLLNSFNRTNQIGNLFAPDRTISNNEYQILNIKFSKITTGNKEALSGNKNQTVNTNGLTTEMAIRQ